VRKPGGANSSALTPGYSGLEVSPKWLRGLDLNQRPLGYEPNELPDCSTPHLDSNNHGGQGQTRRSPSETTVEGTDSRNFSPGADGS
jgi:hypothetical protein